MNKLKLFLVAVENPVTGGYGEYGYYNLLLIGKSGVLESFPRVTKQECEQSALTSSIDLQFVDSLGNVSGIKKAGNNV